MFHLFRYTLRIDAMLATWLLADLIGVHHVEGWREWVFAAAVVFSIAYAAVVLADRVERFWES